LSIKVKVALEIRKRKSPGMLNNYTKNVPVKADEEILYADSHRPSRLAQR